MILMSLQCRRHFRELRLDFEWAVESPIGIRPVGVATLGIKHLSKLHIGCWTVLYLWEKQFRVEEHNLRG